MVSVTRLAAKKPNAFLDSANVCMGSVCAMEFVPTSTHTVSIAVTATKLVQKDRYAAEESVNPSARPARQILVTVVASTSRPATFTVAGATHFAEEQVNARTGNAVVQMEAHLAMANV